MNFQPMMFSVQGRLMMASPPKSRADSISYLVLYWKKEVEV